RAVGAPVWNPKTKTLRADQSASSDDVDPLSLFAAAIHGPTGGFETSVDRFFGAGGRAHPDEVQRDRLSGTLAPATGSDGQSKALFAFRSPVTLKPGQVITLRYIYGFAHAPRIPRLVSKYRNAHHPLISSEVSWYRWLPKANFGPGQAWVARELDWDAYLLRSASMYEELCGHHTITQGGYYQYGFGYNLGTRSWPHYLLPITYSD